jgi:hypothetical protein
MTDEPKPLTDDELAEIERDLEIYRDYSRTAPKLISQARLLGVEGDRWPSAIDRLVAEVRRLRQLARDAYREIDGAEEAEGSSMIDDDVRERLKAEAER